MQMTTFAEHAWLAAEEENSTTVDVCIQAANLGPMAVTLVAVVDFSGSMAGAKLRRVKDTLNYMIDNLSDQVRR